VVNIFSNVPRSQRFTMMCLGTVFPVTALCGGLHPLIHSFSHTGICTVSHPQKKKQNSNVNRILFYPELGTFQLFFVFNTLLLTLAHSVHVINLNLQLPYNIRVC
jgi:hypothetical protein